jgi:hypothetical protein
MDWISVEHAKPLPMSPIYIYGPKTGVFIGWYYKDKWYPINTTEPLKKVVISHWVPMEVPEAPNVI